MPLITKNKKAYYNYKILETLEVGIVLTGAEVKSTKQGKINLTGGYITIDNQSIPWLININISPYPPAWQVQQNYDPNRPRKILLKKKEIFSLTSKIRNKGLTIIPFKVYTKKDLIKIEIGLVQGKKKWDKREDIKKKDWRRKKARIMKRDIL